MAGTDFKYDVFISYSHKDEEWVRNILLPTLEKQGLKACIDYRDFIAGKPAIINMQDASEVSRHTLLVLTPRWVESEWTLYESILSRTDDPSGLQRRTIPLLLENCILPKFISVLTWVDFTMKKRQNEAWLSLFNSLDKTVEKNETTDSKLVLATENSRAILYSEPKLLQQTGQWILVLSATIDDINKPLAEAIVSHLRQLSGDSQLTLQRIESGSVRIIFEGSRSGFALVDSLRRTGQFTVILGLPIKEFRWNPVASSHEGKSVRPTLAVGLGGTGVNFLERFKHNIQTSTLSNSSLINLLAIDMDMPVDSGNEESLTYSEFVAIGGEGSGLSPSASRSALFENYESLISSLTRKAQIVKGLSESIARESRELSPVSEVNAHIVGSLAGGTGTGLAIDIALILRNLLGEGATITGWYLLPSAFGNIVRSQFINPIGNAGLQLLNYSLRNVVSVQYPDGSSYSSLAPLDNIILLDSLNELGQPFEHPRNLITWLAEIIFAESTGYSLDLFEENNIQSSQVKTNQIHWANVGQVGNVPCIMGFEIIKGSLEDSLRFRGHRMIYDRNQQRKNNPFLPPKA